MASPEHVRLSKKELRAWTDCVEYETFPDFRMQVSDALGRTTHPLGLYVTDAIVRRCAAMWRPSR